MPSEIRDGVAVDIDTVTHAAKVLRRALENGDEPNSVVFHDNHQPGHPDRPTNTEAFSLAYGPESDEDKEANTGGE